MRSAGMRRSLRTPGEAKTKMLELFSDHRQGVLVFGALLGFAYGAFAQWSRFCLLRGLQHFWYQGDGRKLRAFALAMATALLCSQSLQLIWGVDLSQSLYMQRAPSFPLLLLGGVLFGVGMSLANACGARSLVLAGSGNLRAWVVLLVLGLSAYMTLSGILAPWRAELEGLTRIQLNSAHLPQSLTQLGLPTRLSHLLPTFTFSALLCFWALKSAELRQSPRDWLGGIIIGLLIALGWAITGLIGADDFDPVRLASLTFVAPIGESLQYLMLASGMPASFSITLVAGILLGSATRALLSGEWNWEGYSSVPQMQRGLLGGLCMGVGGVLALGCTLGQGLTGFSTLAWTSFPALFGILLGARLGLNYLARNPL